MKLLENVPLIKQLEIINRLEFFKDFSLAERQILLESCSHLYMVNQGRHAFRRHEQDNRLFIVLSGEFKIFKKDEHKDLGHVKPGEFIGEGAFLHKREHSTNAQAISNSILLAITPDALTRLPNVIREKIKDQLIIGMSARISKLSSFIENSVE